MRESIRLLFELDFCIYHHLLNWIYNDFLWIINIIRLQEIEEDCSGNLESPVISAVKKQFDCLDVKSKWNPRGINNLSS